MGAILPAIAGVMVAYACRSEHYSVVIQRFVAISTACMKKDYIFTERCNYIYNALLAPG
jgi:hypothetical protein